MSRPQKPGLEHLEDRCLPATFGIPWQDPSHLSISFAPDGTAIAAHESDLSSALDGQFDPEVWERALLAAFQTWARYANLNFGFRADGGQAFGTPGLAQGDPRFGDIRIGAHDMTPEVLAISIPPDPALSGTWTGDVFLNSATDYAAGGYSLFAIALHEAGNALGLADNDDPNSVMYRFYNGTRTDLAAGDVARIQALYGVRAADSYEGALGNDTRGRASAFRLPAGYKGETPLVAFGDLTAAGDKDFYRFSFYDDGNDDQNDRSVTIRLQTAGSSLLAPRLTVLDAAGRVLARRVSASYTGDVLQVTLTGLSSEGTYYLRVDTTATDAFAFGRYGLSVRENNTSSTPDAVIDHLLRGPFDGLGPDAIDTFFRNSGDALLDAEESANETPATATSLTASAGYAAGTHYEAVASIAKKEDADVYRIAAPTGAATVLTASVWTTATDGFQPRVAVLDAAGRPVAATVLANGNGTSTVQVTNATPGAVYYVKVTVSEDASPDKGNYWLSAHFGPQAAALRTFGSGTLSTTDTSDATRLYVANTQLFHFVLTVGNEDPGATVRVTIRDAAGNVVHALRARAGESASGGSVLLRPGQYTVTYEIDNPNGPAVTYRLQGQSTSNPIGPVPSDATLTTQYTSALNPGVFIYPGFSVPYDPRPIPGYVNPADPATYPPEFILPPELVHQLWLLVTRDPFAWIPLE